MSEHSREPWRVVKSPRLVDGDECIASANSTPDAWGGWNNAVLGASESLALSNADARRIVACVNACAGIPTEVLEAMNLGRLADLVGRPAGLPASLTPPAPPDTPPLAT